MNSSRLASLYLFATLLAFCVVVLGAYVRLSEAGLGCPDWPGCYGHLVVPSSSEQIGAGTLAYSPQNSDKPLEPPKAWKEMIHRYLASTLGTLVLFLFIVSLIAHRHQPRIPIGLPFFLVLLVMGQGALGMWTVTLKLHPLVVMSHLLGGLTLLSLLFLHSLRLKKIERKFYSMSSLKRGFGYLALIILIGQIILGGWTSSNYAALACPDFPTCQQKWCPDLDVQGAFGVWHEFGKNYEGGVLQNTARATIHWFHRLGALTAFFAISIWSIKLIRSRDYRFIKTGTIILFFLIMQISLGISNVIFLLPLPIAVMHNATAALLLQTVVASLIL